MADKKDTRSSRSKMLDEMPNNLMTRLARKASRVADKLGFTQEDKYGGKTKEEVMKKAEGGMLKKKEKLVKETMKKSPRVSKYDQEKVERMLADTSEKEMESNPRPSIRDQEKVKEMMGYKKGGMVTARGQGKVMKKRSCKVS